jgi:hypothetical protein
MPKRLPADAGVARLPRGVSFLPPQPAAEPLPPEESPGTALARAGTDREGEGKPLRRGRAGRTVYVKPPLLAALDDAYRRVAASIPGGIEKGAWYEALWIAALERLAEIRAMLAADPLGETLVERHVPDIVAALGDRDALVPADLQRDRRGAASGGPSAPLSSARGSGQGTAG